MKDLRENAGPFFMAVSKLCPWCAQDLQNIVTTHAILTFALQLLFVTVATSVTPPTGDNLSSSITAFRLLSWENFQVLPKTN